MTPPPDYGGRLCGVGVGVRGVSGGGRVSGQATSKLDWVVFIVVFAFSGKRWSHFQHETSR